MRISHMTVKPALRNGPEMNKVTWKGVTNIEPKGWTPYYFYAPNSFRPDKLPLYIKNTVGLVSLLFKSSKEKPEIQHNSLHSSLYFISNLNGIRDIRTKDIEPTI